MSAFRLTYFGTMFDLLAQAHVVLQGGGGVPHPAGHALYSWEDQDNDNWEVRASLLYFSGNVVIVTGLFTQEYWNTRHAGDVS